MQVTNLHLRGAAIIMNKYANGEGIEPSDLLFMIPFAGELVNMLLNQSAYRIISGPWESGLPYSVIHSWEKHCKDFNLNKNDIFFQYTDLFKTTNKEVLGTSILILDKNLALNILGFTPKYLNYNSITGFEKGSDKLQYFIPIEQSTEFIWK